MIYIGLKWIEMEYSGDIWVRKHITS